MTLVVDASATAALVLPDEAPSLSLRIVEALRYQQVVAPWIWWFEVRNVLVLSERRGRLTVAEAATALSALQRLGVITDDRPDEAAIVSIARRQRLTAYDAAYIELASRLSCPLATLDLMLGAAASREGVALPA